MKLKNLLMVGLAAAGAFWFLARRSHAQGNTTGTNHAGTSYNAVIVTTEGERLRLREENGLILDQNGGIWT